jgi:hypothetical protein
MTHLTKVLFATGLFALLGSLPLAAQSNRLTADIPFAFHVSGKILPAGAYDINPLGPAGSFQVRKADETQATMLWAPVPRSFMPTQSKLVFVHSGSEYILSEIAVGGTSHTNALSRKAVESNLTHKLGIAALISVPLRAAR